MSELERLPTAETGRFLRGFQAFEVQCVNAAFHSLTEDKIPRQLGLHARLTLLKRLAMVRGIENTTLGLLDRVITDSARLQEKYQLLMRVVTAQARSEGPTSPAMIETDRPDLRWRWLPTTTDLHDYSEETGELQGLLNAFTNRCRACIAAHLSYIPGDTLPNSAGPEASI